MVNTTFSNFIPEIASLFTKSIGQKMVCSLGCCSLCIIGAPINESSEHWIGQKEICVFDHNLILLSMLTTKSRTLRPKLVLLIQIILQLEFPVSETKHGGVCVCGGGAYLTVPNSGVTKRICHKKSP
jgi:hypothetical protein